MIFHKSIITKHLLSQKLGKLQKKYDESRTCKILSNYHKRDLERVERILETKSMYCQVCDKKFGEEQIGETIVIQKRGRPYITTKWYCVKCCESKNIIVGDEN